MLAIVLDLLLALVQRYVVSPGITGRGRRPRAAPRPWQNPPEPEELVVRNVERHVMNRRTLLGLALVGSLTAALAACGGGGDPLATTDTSSGSADSATVTVGSANFAESELLAEMYAQALEKAGAQVKRKFNIGARELYLKALEDGSIDLLPEYNGALLAGAVRPAARPRASPAPSDVLAALKKVLPGGTEVLEQSAAEDKDTLTVTQATATKYNLKTIEDLEPVAGRTGLRRRAGVPGALPGSRRAQGALRREVQGVQARSTPAAR